MNKTILITGATGRQGGAVARHLLGEGWKVRAFTRHPDSDASFTLLNLGAEIMKGDLNIIESVRRVLEGVYGVFSVQNAWEHGVDTEVEQGNRLIDEAKKTGVAHFVYSSVSSAQHATGIPHFDSKWKIEQHLRSSGIPATVIRPVFFMENLLVPDTLSSIEKGILTLGTEPEKPLQMIAVNDIGAFAARVFGNPDQYIGTATDIAGDDLTGQHMADILSHLLHRYIEYRQTPIEQIRSFSNDYAMMVEWFNIRGYSVNIAAVQKELPDVTTFRRWVVTHRDVLNLHPAHV